MKDKALIFFTRIPTLGKTKTRLQPFLSKQLCVDLQTAFITDIYTNIRHLNADIIVYYSDHGDLSVLQKIIGDQVTFKKQSGLDLGEKMFNAIRDTLLSHEEVLLIGSDLPFLTKEDLDLAFKILASQDVVIAPTFDGGYYLIGMKKAHEELFKIKYSRSSVFAETIDKIKSLSLSYRLGNIQLDIDDQSDFEKLLEILQLNKQLKVSNTREVVNKVKLQSVGGFFIPH